jgi:hypothetical protein
VALSCRCCCVQARELDTCDHVKATLLCISQGITRRACIAVNDVPPSCSSVARTCFSIQHLLKRMNRKLSGSSSQRGHMARSHGPCGLMAPAYVHAHAPAVACVRSRNPSVLTVADCGMYMVTILLDARCCLNFIVWRRAVNSCGRRCPAGKPQTTPACEGSGSPALQQCSNLQPISLALCHHSERRPGWPGEERTWRRKPWRRLTRHGQ